MDNQILKKKLNTYKTQGGKLKGISDDLYIEFLRTWENWQGTATQFYTEVGISKMQLASLMKKAKKLNQEGRFASEDFKEVKIADNVIPFSGASCSGAELFWEGKQIRFSQVEMLIDFLKKAV